MTKTYKEIVYSVLEGVYKYRITDDKELIKDLVGKKIADVNIRIVEEVFKQGMNIDMCYQKVCCIEVACSRPECLGEETGTVLWKAELPMLNTKVGYKNIKYLGLTDMEHNFRRVDFSTLHVSNALEFSKETTYAIIGNEAYFKNLPNPGIKFLCLVGIVSDPITACNWDDDNMYPTPDPYKLEIMVKQDILSSYGIMKDEQQDGRDNSQETPQKPQRQNEPE